MSVIINASTSAGLVMTSDLSGNLQFQNNGVNLPMGGVAPAFSAYANASQTINNVSATKIQFNTKEFDTNNNFDNVTNYRFTPTVAGYYQVTSQVNYVAGLISNAIIWIYKNGSAFKRGNRSYSGGTTFAGINISSLVYMNGSTDYIEIYTYQDSGSSLGTEVVGANNNYFQACLVRGA
jgi:hypothetical protein